MGSSRRSILTGVLFGMMVVLLSVVTRAMDSPSADDQSRALGDNPPLRGGGSSATIQPIQGETVSHKSASVSTYIPVFKHKKACYIFTSAQQIPKEMFDKFKAHVSSDGEHTYSSRQVDDGSILFGAVLSDHCEREFEKGKRGRFTIIGTRTYSKGEVVAVASCDWKAGYLAAMNVVKDFSGDKLSSELAFFCFSMSRGKRDLAKVSVFNVGGASGAISYARGAKKAGFSFAKEKTSLRNPSGIRAIADLPWSHEEKEYWANRGKVLETLEFYLSQSQVESKEEAKISTADSSTISNEIDEAHIRSLSSEIERQSNSGTGRVYIRRGTRAQQARPSLSNIFSDLD